MQGQDNNDNKGKNTHARFSQKAGDYGYLPAPGYTFINPKQQDKKGKRINKIKIIEKESGITCKFTDDHLFKDSRKNDHDNKSHQADHQYPGKQIGLMPFILGFIIRIKTCDHRQHTQAAQAGKQSTYTDQHPHQAKLLGRKNMREQPEIKSAYGKAQINEDRRTDTLFSDYAHDRETNLLK